MSDLISRSELYDQLANKLTWLMRYGNDVYLDVGSDVKDVIDNMPTAYDIDKVVEELNTMSQLITIKDMFKVHENVKMVATDIAIEIVKQGVVADDVCGSIADKIKVTSLEVIVTGKREKPYYEIKYKEVGEIDYKIGYSSYDLNNVFDWRDEFFEIVNHK